MYEGKLIFKRNPSKCQLIRCSSSGWTASVHAPLHAAHAADGAVLEEAGTEVDWQQEVRYNCDGRRHSFLTTILFPGPRPTCSRRCLLLRSRPSREYTPESINSDILTPSHPKYQFIYTIFA